MLDGNCSGDEDYIKIYRKKKKNPQESGVTLDK